MKAKDYAPAGTLTKTSIMLGCGETPDQVVKTMEKVRAAGVDVMTFGQYMRPSKRHMPVSEYITPEAFEKYQVLGTEMVCFITSFLPSAKMCAIAMLIKMHNFVLNVITNHFATIWTVNQKFFYATAFPLPQIFFYCRCKLSYYHLCPQIF